ncbi:hypothetical protein Tdes44962_MAKER00157 [Teratosphaeria destructans]|uniref:RING-type domain-containing protein n=1 Tax=Teratosphaeria destructans TaxID=418781 RepID=A0A9W7SUZ9_9PEZI|nr:hypothetical protein Tdes44962_MAKER00157 [Teratosphaeria destructans]
MATLDTAQIEFAKYEIRQLRRFGPSLTCGRSLEQDDIPAKFRCASCNQVAVDAVKLPCCDQAVCYACSQTLGDDCPVCGHSPLDSTELKPNKSLRISVNVWLRTEYKKRFKSGNAVEADPTPASEAAPAVVESIETPAPAAGSNGTPAPATISEGGAETLPVRRAAEADAVHGAANGDSEVPAEADQPHPTPAEEAPAEEAEDGDAEGDEDEDKDDVDFILERPEEMQQEQGLHDGNNGQQQEMDMQQHQSNMGGQQSFNGMGLGGTGFGGDMSGMGGMHGGFNPMMGGVNMGMPFGDMMGGMGSIMNPMQMLQMMNMGGGMDMGMMGGMGPMGMGGFNGMGPGGMNMGYNGPNGYNNQQYGNPNFAGQNFSRGGYGRGGRGFRGNRGFQNAYNPRGRGGYGGYQNFNGPNSFQQQQSGYMNQQQTPVQGDAGDAQQDSAQAAGRGSPTYDAMASSGNTNNVQPRETEAGPGGEATNDAVNTNDTAAVDGAANAGDGDAVDIAEGAQAGTDQNGDGSVQQGFENGTMSSGMNVVDDSGMQNGSYQDGFGNQQQQNYGWNGRGRAAFRGGRGSFRGGRGSFYGNGVQTEATDLTPTPAPAAPINAPSGPKAMREGKPNTGWYSRPQPTPSVAAAPTPQPETPVDRDAREKDYEHSRADSRDRERSRRERRHDEDDGYESDATYERRKKEERAKRKEKERREEKYDEDGVEDTSSRKYRSRDHSAHDDSSSRRRDDAHKSSRSHRDRSRDRERRKRDDRSRSPDERSSRRKSHKYDDDYDLKDRARKSSRREDDYDSKERSSRRHERSDRDRSSKEVKSVAVINNDDDDVGFRIKGSKSASINPGGMAPPPKRRDDYRDSSSRRDSDYTHRHASSKSSRRDSDAPAVSEAKIDPYAAEREKMERQRQKSHSQRLGKRGSRDFDGEEDGAAPRGPKGSVGREGSKRRKHQREMSVRYEDEFDG